MPNTVKIVMNNIRRCFYRGEEAVLDLALMNFFPHNLTDCCLKLEVAGGWRQEQELTQLAISAPQLRFKFDTTLLKSGEYRIDAAFFSRGEKLAGAAFGVTIVPPRRTDRMQLWHWPTTIHYNALESDPESARCEIDKLAALGCTWAQLRASWAVGNPKNAVELIEYAMTRGIEMGILIENTAGGYFRADADTPLAARRIDSCGQVTDFVFPHHPQVLQRQRILLERIMLLFRELPAFSSVFMNSEVEDKLKLPCNPEALEMHRAALGFDPLTTLRSTERVFAEPYPDAPVIQPGVIADDDPEYLYAKYYFKQGDGWVITNRAMSEVIHHYRPDIRVIADPLRVCSVYGRFDGPDIVSSWTYTNPDPKATLFIETLETEAKPERKGVMHTITLWNYAGTLVPSANDRFAREKTLRMEPGRFLENAWINFSRGPEGIGVYFGSPMELFFEGGDPFIYSPETEKAISSFAREVMEPFGALLRRTRNVPRRAAVLDSFASRVYGVSPRPYNHYTNYYIYNFYTLLNMAHIPADVLFDESVEDAGLDSYDLLVLPNCDTLPQRVYDRIIEFVRRGGLVVADQYLRAEIPGVIRFDFDFTYRNRVNANAITRGSDFAVKDDTAFHHNGIETRSEGITAEQDQQIMERYAAALRRVLDANVKREVDCTSPRLLLNLREANGVKYLLAVNDHRTYGERVGKYRSVLEKGLPEQAEIILRDPGFVPVIYDLTRHRHISCRRDDDGNYRFELQVPAAWGAILSIAPTAPAEWSFTVPEEITRGTALDFHAESAMVDGVWPLQFTLTDAVGNRHDSSGYYPAANGRFDLSITPAANDLPGNWRWELHDLTTGKKYKRNLSVW